MSPQIKELLFKLFIVNWKTTLTGIFGGLIATASSLGLVDPILAAKLTGFLTLILGIISRDADKATTSMRDNTNIFEK